MFSFWSLKLFLHKKQFLSLLSISALFQIKSSSSPESALYQLLGQPNPPAALSHFFHLSSDFPSFILVQSWPLKHKENLVCFLPFYISNRPCCLERKAKSHVFSKSFCWKQCKGQVNLKENWKITFCTRIRVDLYQVKRPLRVPVQIHLERFPRCIHISQFEVVTWIRWVRRVLF